MSAWSDFKVTGDYADYETYRHECEVDEKEYRDSLIDWDEDEEDEEE